MFKALFDAAPRWRMSSGTSSQSTHKDSKTERGGGGLFDCSLGMAPPGPFSEKASQWFKNYTSTVPAPWKTSKLGSVIGTGKKIYYIWKSVHKLKCSRTSAETVKHLDCPAPIKVQMIYINPTTDERVKTIKSQLQQIPLHVSLAHYRALLWITLLMKMSCSSKKFGREQFECITKCCVEDQFSESDRFHSSLATLHF